MKTHIIKLLLAFMATASMQTMYSQTISFGYDAAGNRISRTIVFIPTPQLVKAPAPLPEEPEVFSEQLSNLIIKIYPNPTHGILKVEISNLPENKEASLFLYNLSGKQLLQEQTVGGTEELNITNQPEGTYILRIVAGENKSEWKIIKK